MNHQEITGQRLTIYCVETDRHEGKPLYEWLTNRALDLSMSGVTVERALAGFGRHRKQHFQHLLALSDDLPLAIQLIDTPDKIDRFIQQTDSALAGYTFIREDVRWHRPQADD